MKLEADYDKKLKESQVMDRFRVTENDYITLNMKVILSFQKNLDLQSVNIVLMV